jgi:hypothetical protein
MKYVYDDGGRAAAGFRGKTGDCVCRAIAIATGRPYREVYDELTAIGWNSWRAYWRDGDGLYVPGGEARRRERAYIESLGWKWTPTMRIGQGCKVHLRADELPAGRLLVSVSRHLVAVIDGVIRDIHDCSRDGTRCVYGYFMPSTATAPRTETEVIMGTRTDYAYGQSDYLRADEMAGKSQRVTITDVSDVEFEKGLKPVLTFKGHDRKLVVNATNYDILADAFGNNTARWLGHAILLEGVKVPFKGKRVDSIRVNVLKPKQPTASASTADETPPFDDEIPDFAP